ncbi:MAG: hypothetical protein IJ133_00395, partial [Clostridia bacterium]|nr:hypothetical protein [Clostridia bacterium]
ATTEGNLVFLATIEMNTGNSSFKVRAYDPHVSYEGKTFQEIYGGEDADMISEEHFIKCFAKKYNTNVDKFVIVKEPNAANIMFCLGAPTVNIPQDVDYSGNDFSLHLMEGDQTLGGAEFFNYLRWLGRQDKSSAYKAQANVLADLIDQSLNESNAEAGQSIFETLSDQVDTDISINDFARYADFLAGLSEPSNRTITAD